MERDRSGVAFHSPPRNFETSVRTLICNQASNPTTSSPGPSARYPQQMALVQADATGIVSGGSAKILVLFLIAQTGLNNAMRMSIVLKCVVVQFITFGFIFTFNFVRNKEKSFE